MDGKHVPDINDDKTLWPGVLNFQIRFVNGSNSVLLPITCTFKALKTFLPELLLFLNFSSPLPKASGCYVGIQMKYLCEVKKYQRL